MLRRGEIYYIENSKQFWDDGRSPSPGRPAIIVSHDALNRASPVVEVVYLTTADKKELPTHVSITGRVPSTALCENIQTVKKERVGTFVRMCTDDELKALNECLKHSLGIDESVPEDNRLKAERDLYKDLYEHLLERVAG